jgi:hypothetical protein
MAAITGEVRAEHGGRTYTLRFTALGLGRLQEEFGSSLGGLLDGTAKESVLMLPMVGIIREALRKGERMPHDEAQELADDMLTADMDLAVRVLNAAFPPPKPGKSAGRRAA